MHDSWKKKSRPFTDKAQGKPANCLNSRSKSYLKGYSSAGETAKPHGVARVISKRGYCSRSQAEKLVREGRVTLRGKVVTNPEAPTFDDDEILVDGNAITACNFIYFMMNKPRGYVTTANDELGRKTVMDLFTEQFAKMFPGKPVPHISPVGRLDAASEGVLLFTNDTEWADGILEPAQAQNSQHTKVYRVQVAGHPTAEHLAQMEKGFNVPPRVFGEKEEFMHTVSAKLHSEGEKNCWLEITLDEGKNREIRRMLAHLGFEVMRLMRIKFCDYELGDLKSGCIRQIET